MRFLPPLLFVALISCAGGEPIRYQTPRLDPGPTISTRYNAIEVREVSMPVFSASEEITVAADGGVQADPGALWADEPSRAMTLDVARALTGITGAIVGPAPWPFRSFPDVAVDIRMESFGTNGAGAFRLSGQYFVAPDDPTKGRNRAGLFDIAVPLNEAPGVAAISQARAQATVELARLIASEGLR